MMVDWKKEKRVKGTKVLKFIKIEPSVSTLKSLRDNFLNEVPTILCHNKADTTAPCISKG